MKARESLFRERSTMFLLLLLLSVVNIYAYCKACWAFDFIPWELLIQSATLWMLLGYGHTYINFKLDQEVSWIHHTSKRLLIGFLATVAFTVIAVYGHAWFFGWLADIANFNTYGFSTTLAFSLTVTLIITTIALGRSFLLSWRESAIYSERLKRENIQSRFETLKNQVNPHFLFNSFNVLTELVYQDADKAANFIQQLAEVYRYVLEKREQEIVSLEDEIDFLEKYIYLQKIRFQSGLNVDIEINDKKTRIPPMTLQLLVENAIKHNIISEDQPLKIQIVEKEGYLEVINNIQEKMLHESSSGIGLENIQERYSYLSDREVIINRTAAYFSVKLPLLKIKQYANPAH